MARKRTFESIDAEIQETKAEMDKLQDKYNKLAENLKMLQEQKRKAESDAIMDAYLKSGKSYDELMTFLTP